MDPDRLRKGPDSARPEPYAPLGWPPVAEPADPFASPGPRVAGHPAPTTAAQQVPHPPLPLTPEASSRAVVALVLALASFLVCPLVPAVVALCVAPGAHAEIRASGGRLTGDGLATAATVLSWINVAVCLVIVVGLVVLLALVTSGGL